MAKFTPTQIYNLLNGKQIDFDGVYGLQCVDGARVIFQKLGINPIPTPNNWANGYWTAKNANGQTVQSVVNWQSKNFEKITGAKNFKDGDIVVWDYGSKSHPFSHVCMYYKDKAFGENQGGNRGFRLISTDFTDALGALRPKCWIGSNASNTTQKTVVASGKATAFNNKYTGIYTVTAKIGLNMRDGSGLNRKILCTLPFGHKVNCYGYYSRNGNVTWLYVQTTLNGTSYTGFVSNQYLRK